MPTGYTYQVENGEITTLEQYAMTCARAFGALITMRDDPMDKPIPENFEPNTKYYDEHIERASAALQELPSLGVEECDARAKAEFDAAMASHIKGEKERYEQKVRYANMKEMVTAWKVPSALQELKNFMIQQIDESTKFGDYKADPPVRLTGEKWREKELEKASRDLAYYTKERDKEIERVKGRNQWLADLRAALAR